MATELVQTKEWWRSKTVWVQVITGVLSVIVVAVDILGAVDVPNEATILAALKMADSVLNIILRSITKAPLTV